MWKGVKEYFTYTKKQRNGIYVLIAVVIFLWLALLFDDLLYLHTPHDFTDFKKEIARWEREDSITQWKKNHFEPFYFNPNTASDSLFLALKLSPWQVRIINNYRNKGGRFREASDLRDIYGIDSGWYQKVKPYVNIPRYERYPRGESRQYSFERFDLNRVTQDRLVTFGLRDWQARNIISYREKVRPYTFPGQLYEVYGLDSSLVRTMTAYAIVDTGMRGNTEKPPEVIELNAADTVSLMKVKGIGPVFAKRILRYRDRLGGFYAPEQLLEVYGFDEERYRAISGQLRADLEKISKININTASFKELLQHPYLEYEVVRNIIRFREKRRPFKSVDELKNIELVDEVLFSKIAKYLTI